MEIKNLIPTNWFTDEKKKRPLSFYSPLRKIRYDMDKIFNEFFSNYDEFEPRAIDFFVPRSDILETKNEYKVLIDIPGMEEKDVDVSVNNGVLQISGKKEHSEENKDAQVHRIERSYGSFKKTIQLPKNVSEDKIEANFKNGVLEILLPKTEESKEETKKIKVQSK